MSILLGLDFNSYDKFLHSRPIERSGAGAKDILGQYAFMLPDILFLLTLTSLSSMGIEYLGGEI